MSVTEQVQNTAVGPAPTVPRGPRRPAAKGPDDAIAFNAAVIAPRFHGVECWPWLSGLGPMRHGSFTTIHVDNNFAPFPPLTPLHRRLQYRAARRRIEGLDVAFLFSPDIGIGLTAGTRPAGTTPRRVYVGFTQDGHWSARRIETMGRALRRCDAVTTFTEAERAAYVERYRLQPHRVCVVPIHDAAAPVAPAPPIRTHHRPFILTIGAMNRDFATIARIARAYHLSLVVLTRGDAPGNDLDELRQLGAEVVLDAPLPQALGYIKDATVVALPFQDPSLPAGFTTIMHAMRLGTPVVASECLGVRELIFDGCTGLVTPHGDPVAMRKAIRYLWRDARPRRAMAAAARRRWVQRHAAPVAAKRFHGLTQELLAGA